MALVFIQSTESKATRMSRPHWIMPMTLPLSQLKLDSPPVDGDTVLRAVQPEIELSERDATFTMYMGKTKGPILIDWELDPSQPEDKTVISGKFHVEKNFHDWYFSYEIPYHRFMMRFRKYISKVYDSRAPTDPVFGLDYNSWRFMESFPGLGTNRAEEDLHVDGYRVYFDHLETFSRPHDWGHVIRDMYRTGRSENFINIQLFVSTRVVGQKGFVTLANKPSAEKLMENFKKQFGWEDCCQIARESQDAPSWWVNDGLRGDPPIVGGQ